MIKQTIVTLTAHTSATHIEYHIPSSPKTIGSNNTPSSSNTSVLKDDIKALIGPLLSAVKNDEP